MEISILLIPLLFGLVSDSSWQTAFCDIGLVGSLDILHCDRLQDKLMFEQGTGITIEFNNVTDTAKFSSTSGNSPNELYCTIGKWFNAYNGTTNDYNCETVPTGSVYENNTASNVGVGFGLFKQKTGVDLEFLNIFCAGDLLCSSNSTDFRISASIPTGVVYENNTMSSPTLANTLVLTKTGVDLPIKGIACSGSAVCLSNTTDVTITVSAGSGEANTQSSPTLANTLVLTKSGVDLPIKGIGCNGGITCTTNTTDVTVTLTNADKTDITVSSSGATFTIDNDVVTYAKMQNVASDDRFLGRISGASGDTEELTGTQATTLLDLFTAGLKGLVPSGGSSTTYLRGDATWQTISSGSGIPLPPKKWGELIPRSASQNVIGLVSGCSILATASYVYDTTDNSNAILSTTAVTDGINGGIHCSGTNFNNFRGDQNAYMYSKVEWNKITTNRVYVGFVNSATHLPNNAETILDNLSGVGLCVRTTDTLLQWCRNDGDATTDYVSTGVTETAGTVYRIIISTVDSGVTWCGSINESQTCWTTEIPASTTRMYADSTGETDGGGSAILWTQYIWYLQSDK